MRIHRASTRGRTLHTVMGPFTVASDEHAAVVLEDVAIDAVRMGMGAESPWYVDDRGRPTQKLPPYSEHLSALRISRVAAGGSPVAAEQARAVERLAAEVQTLCDVAEGCGIPSVAAIVDPVVRYVALREVKALLGCLARFADPTGDLARAVDALPCALPSRDNR